jgi:hypothetical protein
MIALDLDNTIICYDAAFQTAATLAGCPPPAGMAPSKADVKSAALAAGGNALWTQIQGIAYGEGLVHAALFPGCRAFIEYALGQGEELAIVSHKSEFPAIGPRINLRATADDWLVRNEMGFGGRLPVYYCDSREEKVVRLRALACRALVDDLPEVFQSPGFPQQTAFVLFDPAGRHLDWTATPRISSWVEARPLLFPLR